MFKKILAFVLVMCCTINVSACFCENQSHETENFADSIVDNIMDIIGWT